MTNNDYPFGINPLPNPDTFMRAYRRLCQSDELDQPIDETVAEFAKRLDWPVEATIRVAQRFHHARLIETSLGMGEVVTAETLIEGKYR